MEQRDSDRNLDSLRQQIVGLEDELEETATQLKAARDRYQYLLAVTPGVIYTTQGSGEYACTSVSDNVDSILGFSSWEMAEQPGFWLSRLHPDDARRVVDETRTLIGQGGGTIEYRLRNRAGNYIWIRDTFRVIRDSAGRPSEIVGSWVDISYHQPAEQVLGERMGVINDLQAFVAASPAVIYTTTQTSDGYVCRFVSESLKFVTGYHPWEMRNDPKFWTKRVHPEDAPRVFAEIERLIGRGEERWNTASGRGGETICGSKTPLRSRPTGKASRRRLSAPGRTSPTTRISKLRCGGFLNRWS